MRYLVPLAALSLLLSTSLPAFAYRDAAVLGSSTAITDAVFPPVTSGPGHILPDSPFYFLDKLYQDFRLALVFTPANRARLHMTISGERMAELRVESARNNQAGVDAALTELGHEAMAAANDVRDAASQGQDVTQLARDIHQTMTDYRDVLITVRSQVPDTAYAQKLTTAGDVLFEARVVTEDAFPVADIERETMAALDEQIDEAILGISDKSDRLEKKLNIYNKYASKAAEREVKKQQESASRAATKAQTQAIIEARKKAIQEYLAKAEALRRQREEELAKLKATIRELQAQLKQLRQGKVPSTTLTPTITLTPTSTPTPFEN
ncbi:MAG: DUF5667 domain-containing protein [Patescibacteria group bacterium]